MHRGCIWRDKCLWLYTPAHPVTLMHASWIHRKEGGLYCPPVSPAKLGWFSEVEVGRWALPKLSRTEKSHEIVHVISCASLNITLMSQPVTSLLPSTNHNHNPTTPPTATTTRRPPPTTTHECPVTTTSQKMKTTVHKQRWPPTNNNGHPPEPTTARLTNDGQVPRTDMGGDYPRWVKSPLLTRQFVNMKSRCHVAVHNVATKWRTMTLVVVRRCCLFLTPRWVPPIPRSSQPTSLRHRTMMNRHRQCRAKVNQGHGANMRRGQWRHGTTMTQQRGVTMMQGNDGVWRWQHATMTWTGHQAEGTTTHDDQETTMTHAD